MDQLINDCKEFKVSRFRTHTLLIDIYIVVFMLGFPLIFHDSYYDILQVKYLFYCTITIVFIIGIVITSIIYGVKSKQKFSLKKIYQTLTFSDKTVLIFWLCCVISTFQSEYFYESFWGNEGRYNGLFLMTLYVIMYFIISRCAHVKKWYIHLFLFSGLIVCVLGIADYFQLDLLNFRTTASEMAQGVIFASTIGNINTYVSYVSLIVCMSAILFIFEEKVPSTLLYYIYLLVSMIALVMGSSDSTYLSIGVLIAALPFFTLKKNKISYRLCIVITTYFTTVFFVRCINQSFPNQVIGQEGLFTILEKICGLPLIIILWISSAFFWWKRSSEITNDIWKKYFLTGWTILLLVLPAVFVFALIDVNLFGNIVRYGKIGQYLLFDDSWGTNRGFIWRQAIELYQQFPLSHKLFGYGPDTFAILAINTIKKEMHAISGTYFDSVHNEYLHYLVTIGPIAVISYILFLFSTLKTLLSAPKENSYVYAAAMAIMCYAVQAVVNINVPLVAPMIWLLLSIGMASKNQ